MTRARWLRSIMTVRSFEGAAVARFARERASGRMRPRPYRTRSCIGLSFTMTNAWRREMKAVDQDVQS